MEDNITHGFLASLKLMENDIAISIIKKLTDIQLESDVFYDVQSPSLKNKKRFEEAKSGYLLGISSISSDVYEDSSFKKSSRADGWITDGDKVILIESKLGSRFSKDQLERHKKKLSDFGLAVKPLKPVIWQDVDSIFDSFIKRENTNKTERNILLEFRRHLQMEGVTLDLEKFFNGVVFEIGKHWYSNEPKATLKLLKRRIIQKLQLDIEPDKEQINETRMNYYWLRLFKKKYNSINWRGTVYLNPDSISVDIMAFEPNKSNISEIVETIKKISERLDKKYERLRTWVYISEYGKRRNVQRGRDYDYENLNYNLEESAEYFKNFQNLADYAKKILPKQIGIKYSISNPGYQSKTYWKGNKKSINHEDAKLLKNPERIVKKFTKFLNLSLEEMSKSLK